MASLSDLKVINTQEWLNENEKSFSPPVCNKLMHNEQLIIMFVGGPNVREDYHIEEGEELFYQIKGDMCVKIIENDQPKDVHIKEGELFILPARIPHSPQRVADSIGLVIERKRLNTETDGVRWFVPETTQPLYEKWFHCKDLGVELIPLIKNFFASEEYKTKVPGTNIADKLPYELNRTILNESKHGPFNLKERLEENKSNCVNLTPTELWLQFEVEILKKGDHLFKNKSKFDNDFWLWQLNGSSVIKLNNEREICLQQNESVLIPAQLCDEVLVKIEDETGQLFKVSQNPEFKL